MRHIIYILTLLCSLAMMSCHDNSRPEHYTVTCTMHHGTLHCDSATLMVMDDDYGRWRSLGSCATGDSVFRCDGHVDRPLVARLCFNSTPEPFTFDFILEPTDIAIDIEAGQWMIAGGSQNASYQVFLNRHARVCQARRSMWQRYVQLAQDSALTVEIEQQMVRQDSVLQDSLQRMTVSRINVHDPASRLVKRRLLNTLTARSMEQLDATDK